MNASPSLLLEGLAVILGLPLLMVLLGEVIHRLRRRGSPIAGIFSAVRTLIIPLLAVWFISARFFSVPSDGPSLQVVRTLFWICLTYTLLLVFRNLVASGERRSNWQIIMPNLLFQLVRALLVVGAFTYLLATVWKIDVSKIMGTLGIGSLVIALALQDTLSNLVSGFLLIIESPFKVGDWIKVGDIEGEVIEINWRAVRLRTIDRDVVIIPNGNLGKENICNFVLNDPLHAIRLEMDLSSADHPDLVQQTLMQVMLGIDGILATPEPEVDPMEYKNAAIRYEIRFFITDYAKAEPISDEFLRRAYYAMRRAGLTFPYADRIEQRTAPPTVGPAAESAQLLAALKKQPLFAHLDDPSIRTLAASAKVELFGVGEKVVQAGHPDEAFFLLLGGQVSLEAGSASKHITSLSEGEFLGESVLLSGEPSPVTATVEQTATLLRIEGTAMNQLVQRKPRFALEISQFIDERRKLIRNA
jgi:small-conductance mechanosensitive channel